HSLPLKYASVWEAVGRWVRLRWLVVVPVSVLLLVIVSAVVLVRGGDPAKQDARTVFCLSAAQRPQLVEAARLLHVADPVQGQPDEVSVHGQMHLLDQWPDEDRPSFDQACSALAGAHSMATGSGGSGGSGGGTSPVTFALGVLAALVPLAAGS